MKDALNLIWIDLEMTGLSPEKDRIIEIATVVTDKDLNILGEGPVYAISQRKRCSTVWTSGILGSMGNQVLPTCAKFDHNGSRGRNENY